MKNKITPFLWFDKNAEEAINFYIDVFNGSPANLEKSQILEITRYPTDYQFGPTAGMQGKILTAIFTLAGREFMALDGGPVFKFTSAISLYVECEDQAEIDYFWEKMSANPKFEQCGWLKDKYGLSWQIIPAGMGKLMKSKAAMDAMLKMKKIDIAKLEAAAKQ